MLDWRYKRVGRSSEIYLVADTGKPGTEVRGCDLPRSRLPRMSFLGSFPIDCKPEVQVQRFNRSFTRMNDVCWRMIVLGCCPTAASQRRLCNIFTLDIALSLAEANSISFQVK